MSTVRLAIKGLAICLVILCSPLLAERELVVLHTNDIHARVIGVQANDNMCSIADRNLPSCFGGFDRIKTAVDQERKKYRNVLLLDAGDQFQGSMFHLVHRGIASAQLMSRIGYEAMTAGNHEFDGGPGGLADFIGAINFPMVSANIDASKSSELRGKIKPYVIVKKNDLRIGVVGYTTEDTSFLSAPGSQVVFKPIIESVRSAVAELKRANVDVIIAVSHAGLNKDIEVASAVDGIAVIVCGHTNSLLSNIHRKADGKSPMVVRSPSKNPVLLVGAYAYGKFLGEIKFAFDRQGVPVSWKSEPILLDHSIPRNQELTAMIDSFHAPIAQFERILVGKVPVEVDGQSCRFEECLAGNLITDSMLNYALPFGVDIALMNGGGIRGSLPKGMINQAQLQDVLPFPKTLVLFRLTGEKIRQIIEHGVSYVEDPKNGETGRFLQVAGLSYSFDPRKPRGMRVSNVTVIDKQNGLPKPLELKRTYGVVTNSYLASGGDNFHHFLCSKERWNISIELKELLTDYFQSPLSQLPNKQGRIINLAN